MKRLSFLLVLLFLSFIFVLNLKNVSYAYTKQDLIDYLEYYHYEVTENNSNEYGNNLAIERLYNLYQNDTNIFNNLVDSFVSAGDFSNNTKWIIQCGENSNERIYRIYNYQSLTCTFNNNILYCNITHGNYRYSVKNLNNNTWTNSWQTNGTENNINSRILIFLTSDINDSLYMSNYLDSYIVNQKQWTFIVPRGGSLPLYTNDSVNIPCFDIRIGQDWDINNFDINIYTLNPDNTKTYHNNIVRQFYQPSNTTTPSQYTVYLSVEDLPYNDNTYYLELKYKGNIWRTNSDGQRIIKGNNSIIFPSGTITNQSGDITGSVDLSGIESSLSDINNSIISGDAAIIETIRSGDTFWRNTYDSLFTMDSGDVNDVYLMISSYFPSGETPITIYDTIFGSYSNEPDDFIIRWDDHPLNITWFGGQTLYSGDFIKAGSMNFSKECRDNSVLANIKFWLNTLLTVFIFIAYYRMLYNCFIHMLGVVSEDIPIGEEEHRPIGFGRN